MSLPISIEKRLFQRGVSDPGIRDAIEQLHVYLQAHTMDTCSDLEWWEGFGARFGELVADLDPDQVTALEIAADTLLIHIGSQPWSLARVGLAIAHDARD